MSAAVLCSTYRVDAPTANVVQLQLLGMLGYGLIFKKKSIEV